MTLARRLLALLVSALLLAAAGAGCFDRRGTGDDGDSDADDDAGADRLILQVVGVDAPADADPVVVNMTVDHVALYDADAQEWVPLFVANHQTDVLFSDGVGDPAFLANLPVLTGGYTDIEIIVTTARVTTEDGTSVAGTPQVACYAPVVLGSAGDGETVTLELWMSGPDALERTTRGWDFQPALVGTVSDAEGGEATVSEADCRPFDG